MAAAPPRRRCRARRRRSWRLPPHTNGVGAAFHPATVSSNQVMISCGVCGCCPASARRPGAGGGGKRVGRLGGPPPVVLRGRERGRAPSRPVLPGIRHRLKRPRLILATDRYPRRLRPAVRLLDLPLFCSVWGSVTVTTPLVRLRWAVPVGHQVRVRWYELPASSSTRRMVVAPRRRKAPCWPTARSKVSSDHVAVPSCRRAGGCWAVATICTRAVPS